MAKHSTRRSRDERSLPTNGDNVTEGQAPIEGETLAEKIRRYRQSGPDPDGFGEVAGSGRDGARRRREE